MTVYGPITGERRCLVALYGPITGEQTRVDEIGMTQFEIECRSGGHSVTKKFSAVLQVLVSKLKL